MTNYAVVKIGPRQYMVEPGKTYTIDKFQAEVGSKMDLEVLALGGEDLKIGEPFVDKSNVQIEIIDQAKGEKVVTKQFRAKSRYRRTRGFRKQITTFKVVSIK